MSASTQLAAGQKRAATTLLPDANKRATGPTVTVSGLQKELQTERERQERLQESVEQLRLELQLMGRLLAAAREQLVASGATVAEAGFVLRTPPAPSTTGPRVGRSKSDAKLLQRLQEELSESKGQCRRLAQQVELQQQRMLLIAATKRELLSTVGESEAYLSRS